MNEKKSTLATLADEEWRVLADPLEPEATIVRPDRQRGGGAYIGPLATVNISVTTEDEDGEEVIELDNQDGRNLCAIAALPQFAKLVNRINDGAGADEIRARAEWLSELVDDRDDEMHEGAHEFMSYDRMYGKQQEGGA